MSNQVNKKNMLIFAYGSNMCCTRLQDRVPSTTFVSVGKLFEHKIKLHKISNADGSAKANAFETGNADDYILGVVFEINANEKKALDNAEGLNYGYAEKSVTILLPNNTSVSTQIYFANQNAINNLLIPYSWYMKYIIVGANDYGLPENYINQLNNIPTQEDIDSTRIQENEEILSRHLLRN